MHAPRNVPMVVAAIVAVVGQTVILLNDFGPGNDLQGSGNARMITGRGGVQGRRNRDSVRVARR